MFVSTRIRIDRKRLPITPEFLLIAVCGAGILAQVDFRTNTGIAASGQKTCNLYLTLDMAGHFRLNMGQIGP